MMELYDFLENAWNYEKYELARSFVAKAAEHLIFNKEQAFEYVKSKIYIANASTTFSKYVVPLEIKEINILNPSLNISHQISVTSSEFSGGLVAQLTVYQEKLVKARHRELQSELIEICKEILISLGYVDSE